MDRLFDGMLGVKGESCMFAGSDRAKLRFKHGRILAVRDSGARELFIPGRDYRVTDDGIQRVPGSRIPVLTEQELRPVEGSQPLFPEKGATAIGPGTDGRDIRFQEGLWYQSMQFTVDYEAMEPASISVRKTDNGFRKALEARLGQKGEFRLTYLGDSITYGCNCSQMFDGFPYQQPYAQLVATELENHRQAPVIYRNHAVGGTGCRHALDTIREQWRNDRSDLMVIAYGMNDFWNLKAEEFVAVMEEIIAEARKDRPDTLFMLVASMAGNASWVHTPHEQAGAYAQALFDYANGQSDIGFADVFSAWEGYVNRKGFYPMTGNGVNHPNDFGHRLYASVLLDELLPEGGYLAGSDR